MSLDTRSEKPTTIVIFGASGDLTARKLMPALFNQHRKRRLPASTRGSSATPAVPTPVPSSRRSCRKP